MSHKEQSFEDFEPDPPEGSWLFSLANAITQLAVSYTATNATETNTLPGMETLCRDLIK